MVSGSSYSLILGLVVLCFFLFFFSLCSSSYIQSDCITFKREGLSEFVNQVTLVREINTLGVVYKKYKSGW
jgi:hypothetical protein